MVRIDRSGTEKFVQPHTLDKAACKAAIDTLVNGTGAGNDFTGWVNLPVDYDKEEFARIQKAAEKIKAKKLSLEMSSLTATVLTDEKWAQFIVEQLLSNSLKYTRTGSIRIWQKDPAALVIEDTGIGIDPADIPRLGERGFTGYNGRLDKKSTGIGLYLCKEISRRLSHTLTIESEPGKGTRVTIDFATRQLQAE